MRIIWPGTCANCTPRPRYWISSVTDRRLEAAHAAVQSTGTPLKVLAARLGYSSVSHFSNAFTKKFGYRPGSLRRGKSGR
ncbi:AraC family transcriptional regulator [Methylococcus sp. Mc7]|uniref:helix-turn-helix domain-containing protein n=1 Tax=Methylococcus sp. Mc7 TaxID=2860258 RepID=UPI001C52EB1F|nr:helix-turn-helix domain-containing protein [Methylococcus sp. Mc7]QXP83790.1 helix-turn-helix domain-containing protein [Methylococcus sp. Mc7]